VLLSPAAVEAVVRSFEGLGDEYELIVERPGDVDHITLKVELRPGVTQADVAPGLRDQLRLKTNLGYEIQFFEYGALPRYKLKAKRFKDLRKK
jgi:phenylacetate-CoA ligase